MTTLFCRQAENYTPEFHLEGKWKDIKGDTVFEKDRKEIIFDIQRIGEDYSGHIISLDNAVDANGNLRKCLKCSPNDSARMILGIPFLRNLRKRPGTMEYQGEIYDIQQRKWFSIRIQPISKDKLNIRTYAGFTLFGKNLKWERGDEYYKQILSKSPEKFVLGKRGIYAITPGHIDYSTEKEVVLRCPIKTALANNDPIYFYSLEGRKTGEGIVQFQNEQELRIKVISQESKIDHLNSIPVVFYGRF
jgi:uncharacterized protein (DUF2147 family)